MIHSPLSTYSLFREWNVYICLLILLHFTISKFVQAMNVNILMNILIGMYTLLLPF